LKGIFTFGIWSRDRKAREIPELHRSGKFRRKLLRARKVEAELSAFRRMDGADAFWAARIVSRFSDEVLRAVVAKAEIGDAEAERYLGDVLIQRRDKVGSAVLLDAPRVAVPDSAFGPEDDASDRYSAASTRTLRLDFPRWSEPLVVSLRQRRGEIQIVGIVRPRASSER